MNGLISSKAELFKAGLRYPRVSARFEFRFARLKNISVLILFVYKLMIGRKLSEKMLLNTRKI